jgi:hypothetical protein
VRIVLDQCGTTKEQPATWLHGLSSEQLMAILTQLYGPAVRCKPKVKKWRGLVLRICIRPLHGVFVLLAIMDIRAHPISF